MKQEGIVFSLLIKQNEETICFSLRITRDTRFSLLIKQENEVLSVLIKQKRRNSFVFTHKTIKSSAILSKKRRNVFFFLTHKTR